MLSPWHLEHGVEWHYIALGSFSVAAVRGEDDIWDVALRYAGEFDGFGLAAVPSQDWWESGVALSPA